MQVETEQKEVEQLEAEVGSGIVLAYALVEDFRMLVLVEHTGVTMVTVQGVLGSHQQTVKAVLVSHLLYSVELLGVNEVQDLANDVGVLIPDDMLLGDETRLSLLKEEQDDPDDDEGQMEKHCCHSFHLLIFLASKLIVVVVSVSLEHPE